ncbi:Mediator of RNA polymerase II transcription subunit 8 [Mizuhopecten yessoensis]|uniref:Mediator of RNA polymerase II transcription subunit 8 n=2 Tax=Mizuhopecten yessoensis TaxID=6573 RepID=A0A210PY26_MIZYE|nr:Mediator of RNA polymerase II transcription subunit 8 [Mizuhopecten yessoensis]
MQKEEKQLELALDALIQRVQDLKNSLVAFLSKLENEYQTMSWPSVLDNFALLSGQLNSLGKLLKSEKVPILRNQILLPLALSPDRDQELEKLTERRVFAFNHEVVPDYLRTKPEPDVEKKIQESSVRATINTPDVAQKQLNAMNKVTSNILDIINSHRDDMESDANQKSSLAQTSSMSDTNALIAVTMFGKGLKSLRRDSSQSQPIIQQQTQQPKTQVSTGKAPSAVKTNIKAAAAVTVNKQEFAGTFTSDFEPGTISSHDNILTLNKESSPAAMSDTLNKANN